MLATLCAARIGSRMILGISAHHKERLVMTQVSGNSMTADRAAQIALLVVSYEAKRRSMTLNESDERKEWERYENKLRSKTDLNRDDFREFVLEYMMPHMLSSHFGGNLKVTGYASSLSGKKAGEIALALIRFKGVSLEENDFRSRLERVSKETGVAVQELKQFYMEHVSPQIIAGIMGWDSCSITGTIKQ
jgi:hypothetical protein